MNAQTALQLAEEHLKAGRINPAERLGRGVLDQEPLNPQALAIMGVAAFMSGRMESAIAYFSDSIAHSPSPTALQCHRLGEAYRHHVLPDQAVRWFDRAIAIQPDFADAHTSLALTLLTLDQYERGFREFEWRWRSTRLNTQRIQFQQPTWDGTDPKGKTILLWAEQGLGDVLHAIRYAPLLAQRGARVIAGCQAPLERVLKTVPGLSVATSKFDQTPPFDLQIPSFSLMGTFGTTFETIPKNVPYVFAEPALVEKWKDRLKDDPARRKIGLVWGGSASNPTDSARSIPVTALAPLAEASDVSFYSLQTDARAAEAASAPSGLRLKPVGHLLTDFAETAALLMNLDLLISVDTAAVHLAGAMGRPVWALLAWMNDWRWGLGRSDNPWYPTARLFRQKRKGDWNGVMRDVVNALSNES